MDLQSVLKKNYGCWGVIDNLFFEEKDSTELKQTNRENSDIYSCFKNNLTTKEIETKKDKFLIEYPCKNQYWINDSKNKNFCISICICSLVLLYNSEGNLRNIDWGYIMEMGSSLNEQFCNLDNKKDYEKVTLPLLKDILNIIEEEDRPIVDKEYYGLLTDDVLDKNSGYMNLRDSLNNLFIMNRSKKVYTIFSIRDKYLIIVKLDDTKYHIFDSHGHELVGNTQKSFLLTCNSIEELRKIIMTLYFVFIDDVQDRMVSNQYEFYLLKFKQ